METTMHDPRDYPRRLIVVMCIQDDNGIYEQDAIEYEGEIWLVPEWLDHKSGEHCIPARIIRLEGLRHQPAPNGFDAEWVLNDPMPKDVLDGHVPSELADKYVVIEMPDIRFPARNKQN
jgi:hypothetical protein